MTKDNLQPASNNKQNSSSARGRGARARTRNLFNCDTIFEPKCRHCWVWSYLHNII